MKMKREKADKINVREKNFSSDDDGDSGCDCKRFN